jgi:hypothetical protein
MGHALMENRSGLVVETAVTEANGMAERQAAQEMIVRHSPSARRLTLGADKGYDARAFVADLRDFNVTPHIAQNLTGRRSAIDGRTTRHPGYAVRAETKAHRRAIRLVQDDRRPRSTDAARRQKAPLQVHPDDGGLQSHQNTKAPRSHRLTAAATTIKQAIAQLRNVLSHSRPGGYDPQSKRISATC